MHMEKEDTFHLLRSWYLAHLRKGALADQSKLRMTPASLIAADQDHVMRLVQNARPSTEVQITTDFEPENHNSLIPFAIWLGGVVLFVGLILLNSGGDIGRAVANLMTLTIGLFDPQSKAPTVMPVFILFPIFLIGYPLIVIGQHIWKAKFSASSRMGRGS